MSCNKKSRSVVQQEKDCGLQKLISKRKLDRLEEYEEEVESYRHARIKKPHLSDEVEEEEEEIDNHENICEKKFSSFDDDAEEKEEDFEPQGSKVSAKNYLKLGTDSLDLNSDKILRMMEKYGYKVGSGLGKEEQGRIKPIETTNRLGRHGLGHEATKAFTDFEFDYEPDVEIKFVEEEPKWLEFSVQAQEIILKKTKDWINIKKPKLDLTDETRYCSEELIKELLQCKNMFDHIKSGDLNEARARANPYETVKAGFFQNRAAMKTANIDKIFDWKLSQEVNCSKRHAKNPLDVGADAVNVNRNENIFYFADVCAGPGGFSEYMLWRKAFYNAKGFGFTLIGKDDFKLNKFKAASPEYFEPFYGVNGDGNVMNPDNLKSLEEFVKSKSITKFVNNKGVLEKNSGVHLVMCDGGFTVQGQENIQEILSKRLYLCQFIAGLSLLRFENENEQGGNFLCKLFDLFTPFSIGLIYLLYVSFKRVSLHKPITSRPANSERYIFCEGLTKFGATFVKNYLIEINNKLDEIQKKDASKLEDIYEIVPEEIIKNDKKFFNYVCESNKRQIFYLKKYLKFAKNKGEYDKDQANLRDQCLSYWELPNINRFETIQRAQKPFLFVLNSLVGEKLQLNACRSTPFSINVLKQKPNQKNHFASAEFRAVLLPESSEPKVLVSNGGLNVGIFNGNHFENFGVMEIPYNTIMLVQETEKYEMQNSEIVRCNKLLYIIDAAFINGDNVSNLPLRDRLIAAKKFCDVLNKTKTVKTEKNWKKNNSLHNQMYCEVLSAKMVNLKELTDTKFVLKKYKGNNIATFEHDSSVLTCRAIRIVNILPTNWSMYWSKSNNTQYYFDYRNETTLFETDFKNQKHCSSFYDLLQTCQNTPRSWLWNWDPNYRNNFNVTNLIYDLHNDAGITLNDIKTIMEFESNNIKEENREVKCSA